MKPANSGSTAPLVGNAEDERPLYQQVKAAVVEQILRGCWPEGFQVPSENTLAKDFAISRMTANRALRELTAEGWLLRTQGAGTFVAPRNAQSAVMEVRSIRQEILDRNHGYRGEVLLLQAERARAQEAALLGLEPGRRLFHSLILHFEEAVPVQLEERFVSPAAAPDYLKQDFTQTTPYDYLMSAAPLSEAEHTIYAIQPDNAVRKHLKMARGEPCLLLRRRTWSRGGPVTYALLYHPGSRYSFSSRFQTIGA